ncbi:MAG TPA: hypothetical protein DEQ47_07240 [Solibacterales bacterium]|nr:hypothetical protein [Bryobacterales bacterium]
MPSRIKLALFALAAASLHAQSFAVLSSDVGPWPTLLGSIGLQTEPAATARVLVARASTAADPQLSARVTAGALLILEGESALAASFGFRATRDTVALTSIEDVHRPALPIVLEHALDIARFEVPAAARVFAKDHWSNAPVIAGYKQGQGAVLWVAASPGAQGYERFPYLLHALHDLGLEAPVRSARLWAFFDYSYRTRADLDYLAARWRKAGIAALHVAAWHFYDSDPERDEYLQRLIRACHRQDIQVYAWIELPHVSEKFWNEHPEWREKTALQQDAQLDWRKLMNLINRDCFRAASGGVTSLVRRFDWDGVNLAELYFESLEGMANPARFTPMNADVRAQFRAQNAWDPAELFATRKDAASVRLFLDYRAGLARAMQQEWLQVVEQCRTFHPDLDIVLTHVDDRFDTGMKDAIGADAAAVLPMLKTRDFTFLVEDPATIWNLGPARYTEIARRYQPLTPRPDKMAIDINIVERYQDVYPTKQQTGAELFELVHVAAQAFPRVALYFENSILAPDLDLLPSATAAVRGIVRKGNRVTVDSPFGVGLVWHGPALVDARPWPAQDHDTVWLPAGVHTVAASDRVVAVRLLDFNATLESASVTSTAIELRYRSAARALARFERKPLSLQIDGNAAQPVFEEDTLLLPRGEHTVAVGFE